MFKRILSCTACAILFFACNDDSIINVNDEAKDKANISFLVLDSYSGEAVDSVTILRSKDKKTNLTDAHGYSIWKKNEIGNYVFELSKEGYATIRTSVNVVEKGLGDVARVPDVTKIVSMYKLGAKINGTVLYTDKKTNNKVPAEGITVIITYLNSLIIPSEVSVKTDKDGNYSFTDLPEASAFQITIPQATIDGNKYVVNDKIPVQAQRVDAIVDLGIQNLTQVAQEFALVKSNLNEIDTNTTIKLTFSTTLDKDSITKNLKVLRDDFRVLTNVTLSKDSTTIDIKPFSGNWKDGEYYTISGLVYSANGNSFNMNRSFTVGSAVSTRRPGHVDSLKAELDGSYLNLSWARVDSLALGYLIYYKNDSMSTYVRLLQMTSAYSTEANISYINLLNINAEVNKISFIVIPYNSAGEADAMSAKPISYTFESPSDQVSDLAVKLSGSYAALTWDSPTGTYSYNIYYKSQSMNEYKKIASTTSSTSYTSSTSIMNLLEFGDDSIFFKVVPYNNIGESSLSEAEEVMLSFTLDTLTGLKAEIDQAEFIVTWDKLESASNYTVYYKTSSRTSFVNAGETTLSSISLNVSDYTNIEDTSITFKVIPSNIVHEEILGNAEGTTLYFNLKPDPVTIESVSLLDDEFIIKWQPKDKAKIKRYQIYYITESMITYKLLDLPDNDIILNEIIFPKSLCITSSDDSSGLIGFKLIITNLFDYTSDINKTEASTLKISLEP